MEVSLQLILEHMDLDGREFETSGELTQKYSRVQLYMEGRQPERGCVYVCCSAPGGEYLSSEGTGLIIVGPDADAVCGGRVNECAREDISCEYVLYGGAEGCGEVFNRCVSAFLEIQDQIQSFMKLITGHATLQTLVEEMYGLFHNPVFMVDANFKVLAIERRFEMRLLSATWKRQEDEGYMPLSIVSGLVKSGELDRLETDKHAQIITSPYFYTRFINCYLRHGRRIQGHFFIIEMFNTFTPGDVEMADILSPLVMDAVLGDEDLQRSRGRIYENFMKDLLAGKPMDKSYIASQLSYLGLKEGSIYLVARIPAPSRDMVNERIASRLERFFDVRVVRYEEYLMGLFLVDGRDSIAGFKAELGSIADQWKIHIGLSGWFTDIYRTHVYAAQAVRALELSAGETDNRVYSYDDFAITDILDCQEETGRRFIPAEISLMIDYDREHGTSYAQSLFCFLKNERRLQETADTLCIHRNTLGYRLERMRDIFGIDLDAGENIYRYYLSLKMAKISAGTV